MVGATAGELVNAEVFIDSVEFPSSVVAIAMTLTKYSVPSAIPGNSAAVILLLVVVIPITVALAEPVPGAW
jgi:hypothetical protein